MNFRFIINKQCLKSENYFKRLINYCSVIVHFHANFLKNLQDSIQISEAPKRNLDVHFSLVDTAGHVRQLAQL